MQPKTVILNHAEKWIANNNYNQQTPQNNPNPKFNPKSKSLRKNPIGKATTTKQKPVSSVYQLVSIDGSSSQVVLC
jgi:hypothetical protein